MPYLSEILHSVYPCIPLHVVNMSGNCWDMLISTPVNWYIYAPKWSCAIDWLGNVSELECSVANTGGGQALALSVWRQRGGMAESWGPIRPWQLRLPTVMHPAGRGQGLSPAVSTPISFHGSSLICRICHCRGELLLGGFKPCCHGSQAPSPPYGYFALCVGVCVCIFQSVPHSLSFFITPSCSQLHAFSAIPFLSRHYLFVRES